MNRYLLIPIFFWLFSCDGGGGQSVNPDSDKGVVDNFDFLVTVASSQLLSIQATNEFSNEYEGLLENKLNSTFALPDNDIDVVFQDCGQVNAFYNPSTYQVTMCWDLFFSLAEFLYVNSIELTEAQASEGAALSFLGFVFFHELGHALIDQYDLPIVGKEEDSADNMSIVFWIDLSEPKESQLAAAWAFIHAGLFFANGPVIWTDSHTTGPQRLNDLVCMAVGAVPDLMDDPAIDYTFFVADQEITVSNIIQDLIQSGRHCPNEYADKVAAVKTLLSDYLL